MKSASFLGSLWLVILCSLAPAQLRSQDLLDQLGQVPLDIVITSEGLGIDADNIFLIKRANIVLNSEAGGGYSSWHLNFTSSRRVAVATRRRFMSNVFYRLTFFDATGNSIGEVELPSGDSNRIPWDFNEPADKYYYELDIWRIPIQLLADADRIDITRRR
ncbi:MAG: hypothetical protein AAF433_15485 [Bacteroidota bacterium]